MPCYSIRPPTKQRICNSVEKSEAEPFYFQLPQSRVNALPQRGKYTTLTLETPSNFDYRLRIDTKYGKVNVDESRFDFRVWKEKSSQLEAEGRTRNASGNSPLFVIEGYDNTVTIN